MAVEILGLVEAVGDARHRERVLDLFAAAGEDEKRLLAQFQLAQGDFVMPQVYGNVLRLDVGRLQVNDVEMFAQANDVTRVLEGRSTLAAVDVGDVRRAAHGHEGDVVASEADVVFGVAAMQYEFTGSRIERLFDQPAIETHHPAIPVDLGAGVMQDVARLGIQHLDAEIFEHAQGGVVQRRNAVFAECRLPAEGIAQPAIIDLALMRTVGDAVVATAPGTSGHVSDPYRGDRASGGGTRWPRPHSTAGR